MPNGRWEAEVKVARERGLDDVARLVERWRRLVPERERPRAPRDPAREVGAVPEEQDPVASIAAGRPERYAPSPDEVLQREEDSSAEV